MTKMTDGERITQQIRDNWGVCDAKACWKLAPVIDRLIRRRMAEAFEKGWIRAWETPRVWTEDVPGNPYRGRKRKT